jgi:hypothetical protein
MLNPLRQLRLNDQLEILNQKLERIASALERAIPPIHLDGPNLPPNELDHLAKSPPDLYAADDESSWEHEIEEIERERSLATREKQGKIYTEIFASKRKKK